MMVRKPPKPAAPEPGDSQAARSRQRAIGERLKTFFDSVVDEGVPEDFESLLNKLESDGDETSQSSAEDCDGETGPQTEDRGARHGGGE